MKNKTPDAQPQTDEPDDLATKLRKAADHVEAQPDSQRAIGGGGLLRRLLDILLAELLGQTPPK